MANAQNAAQPDAKADEKVEAKSTAPASLKEKYNEAIKSPLYSAEVKKVAAGVYEMFSAVSTDDKRRELLDAIASAANGRDQTVLTAAYEELQALNKAHAHNNKALNEVRGKYSFEEIVQVYSEDFMKLAYQVSYEVLRHSSELKLAAGSGEKRGRKAADGSTPPAGDGTGKKAAKKTTVYHIEGPNGLKLDMKFKSGPKKYDVNEIPLLDAIGIKYTKAENGKPVVENGPTSRKLADAILAGEHKGFSATTEVIDAPQNEPEEA